jgi:hypothetical protein
VGKIKYGLSICRNNSCKRRYDAFEVLQLERETPDRQKMRKENVSLGF